MIKADMMLLCYHVIRDDGFEDTKEWHKDIENFVDQLVGQPLHSDEVKKQFRIDVLSKISSFDYCIICWEPTDVLKTTHVDTRTHYTQGGGQHCGKCCKEKNLC